MAAARSPLASPGTAAGAGEALPPMLVLVGGADPLLAPAERFVSAARELRTLRPASSTRGGGSGGGGNGGDRRWPPATGGETRLVCYPGGTHGLFDWTRDQAQFEATTAEAVGFLSALGYASKPSS